MDKRFDFSGFTTSRCISQGNKRKQPAASGSCIGFKRNKHQKSKPVRNSSFAGQLTLLSVCTGAFMMLFIYKLVGTNNSYIFDENAVVAAMRDIVNDNNSDDRETEETLGKLQLVQLPSILEIFAPSNAPIPPLAMEQAVVEDGSYIAKIYAHTGTEVVSILPGTVKSVTSDDALGGCVVVTCEDDIDIHYYGLSDIRVERGQPILQNSSIGLVSNDLLCLKIMHHGRPVDPFEFLGIKAEVG